MLAGLLQAQVAPEKLAMTVKEFHQALVKKNTVSINQQTDKALSYGHSNGWVETKTDMIKNLETGYMSYMSYKEDSLKVVINGNVANARFIADISANLNGNRRELSFESAGSVGEERKEMVVVCETGGQSN